jgi:hypothetical protein
MRNVLHYKKPAFWITLLASIGVLAVTVGFAATRTQATPLLALIPEINEEPDKGLTAAVTDEQTLKLLPWANVPQKSDWPVRDMCFDRITFGSDREQIIYRMGREPDAEEASEDGTVLFYSDPGILFTPQEGEESTILPGTAYSVTFYLDGSDGVFRIDFEGGSESVCEMTGLEQGNGKLSGVLMQYGGPNEVTTERGGDSYMLWYYRPDDTDMRMWFEVEANELTGRMGIVIVSSAETETAAGNIIPLYTAQLIHDGSVQTIILDTSRIAEFVYDLRVEDADGRTLWQAEASLPHAGWNTLLLTRIDGKDYLMQYNPTTYQGYSTYSFRVFYLNKDGGEVVYDKGEVAFSLNPPGEADYFRKHDIAPVKAFFQHVNRYLPASELLLNTDAHVAERLPENQRGGFYGTADAPVKLREYFYRNADMTLDEQMDLFVNDYIEAFGELED